MAKQQYPGVFWRDSDKRWAACPTIEGQRRWFYGDDAEEVYNQVQEAKYQARRGRVLRGSRQTVQQFLEEWLAGMKPPRVADRTYVMYGVHMRTVLPAIGAIRLNKLTARHLQLCYADLGETHAPTTIRVLNAVLHQAFEQAVDWDLLIRNPTTGVKLPKAPRHEMTTLSREQVRQLLDGTAGTRWHGFLALMCSIGLRISEQAGLLWTDLDETDSTLSIQRQIMRKTGSGLTFAPLKSDSSYRNPPLPQGTIQALRKHRIILAEERLKAGPKWEDRGLMFPNPYGRPQEPHAIRAGFYSILERLGLPHITPHQLRHTAATLLLEENKHPSAVQKLLGHSNIAQTLGTYSHVTPRVQREIADTMDRLLFGS